MKVYSPSRTIDFMENPVVREIKKQGWVPNTYGYSQLGLISGKAYQEGLTIFYRARMKGEGGLSVIDRAEAAMRASYTTSRIEITSKQISWKDDVYPAVVAAPDTMAKTLRKALTTDPIPPDWEILEVEEWWKEYGNCKPDMIVKTDAGKIFPVDAKYKRLMPTDRLSQTLQEYMYSWQFMHYSWACEEKYGVPVQTHGLLLNVSSPHRVEPHYFPIDPVLKQLWLTSAKSVWAVMAACDGDWSDLLKLSTDKSKWPPEDTVPLPPWHTFLFHGRYGLDPYGEAVLYHKLDAQLMAQSYTNLKAKGQEPGAPEVRDADKVKETV